MIYLNNTNVDPAINHAIEEYFLKETNEDLFMLWRNVPTVLLGVHQDAYAELNLDYISDEGIKIVRRLSGGGTVFCDLGNMQYSFITNSSDTRGENPFELFVTPVVKALVDLGLNAEFTGRNDILIDGKKVSGNAQYRYKNRILHHGTILFDVNREMLSNALLSRPIKFEKKSVKSVISRIGTIREYLPEQSVTEFMDYLKEYIIKLNGINSIIELDEELMTKVEPYIARFRDPSWNMGETIEDTLEYRIKYPFGLVEYKLKLDEDRIGELSIMGDFFSDEDPSALEAALKGIELKERELKDALEGVQVGKYIVGMDSDDLVEDLLKIEGK